MFGRLVCCGLVAEPRILGSRKHDLTGNNGPRQAAKPNDQTCLEGADRKCFGVADGGICESGKPRACYRFHVLSGNSEAAVSERPLSQMVATESIPFWRPWKLCRRPCPALHRPSSSPDVGAGGALMEKSFSYLMRQLACAPRQTRPRAPISNPSGWNETGVETEGQPKYLKNLADALGLG